MSFLKFLMEKSVINLHREGKLCFIFFKIKAKLFILEFFYGTMVYKKHILSSHDAQKNWIHTKRITVPNVRGKTTKL